MVLYATEIVLLEETRVGRPASLASLVVMNRPVAPVYRMPMAVRAVVLFPSWCVMSVVL